MRNECREIAVDDGGGTGRVNRGLRTRKPERGGEYAQSALRALTRPAAVVVGARHIGAAVMVLATRFGVVRSLHLLRCVFVNAQRHQRRGNCREGQPSGKKQGKQSARQAHRLILAHRFTRTSVRPITAAKVHRFRPAGDATPAIASRNGRRAALSISGRSGRTPGNFHRRARGRRRTGYPGRCPSRVNPAACPARQVLVPWVVQPEGA